MAINYIDVGDEVIIETAASHKDFGQFMPNHLRDKIALKSKILKDGGREGELFVNREYEDLSDVVQYIEFLKRAERYSKVTYVTSEEIRTLYNKNDKTSNNTSNIQKQIREYFAVASRLGASDIHLTVKENMNCVVEFRSLGDLVPYRDLTAEEGSAMCRTMYSTMCDVADRSFNPQKAQNGRMKQVYLPDEITGVRLATTPTENGYRMVCRLLYKFNSENINLKSLGLESFHVKALEELTAKKEGATIISGPTGSGKSTLLQAVISTVISDTKGTLHVITVEDPPEYVIFGEYDTEVITENEKGEKISEVKRKRSYATQTPVANAKTPEERSIKFSDAISATMRLDPDVIMIGEVRDESSATAALRGAMTGHQVWTTVHANNALTIFTRLFDIGVDKGLVCDPNIVTGLVAQRLVKKLCRECSVPLVGNEHLLDPNVLTRLVDVFCGVSLEGVRLRNHRGCPKCNTGLSGRTAILEIIVLDDKFMELTANDQRVELRKYWLSTKKGVDMYMHAILKVKQGMCDPFENEKDLGWMKLLEDVDKEHFKNLLENCKS